MRKTFLPIILSILIFGNIDGQNSTKENREGNILIEIKNGSKHKGWLRSTIQKKDKQIKISSTPKGKKNKYNISDISGVMLFPGAKPEYPPNNKITDTLFYASRTIIEGKHNEKEKPNTLLKVEYHGNGIALYSMYEHNSLMIPVNMSFIYIEDNSKTYYIEMGNSSLKKVSIYIKEIAFGEERSNRKSLAGYFEEQGYKEFALRILNKEFNIKDNPIEVIQAWEKEYHSY